MNMVPNVDMMVPNGGPSSGGGRIPLTTATTYYVSTTGSDSNDGLTLGTAWATLQHTIDYISSKLDIAGFAITISINTGTYAGLGFKSCVGGGGITYRADNGAVTIAEGPNDGVYNSAECASFYFGMGDTQITFGIGTGTLTFSNSTQYAMITIFAGFLNMAIGNFSATLNNTCLFFMNPDAPSNIFVTGGIVLDRAAGTTDTQPFYFQGGSVMSGGASFNLANTLPASNGIFIADQAFIGDTSTFVGSSITGPPVSALHGGSISNPSLPSASLPPFADSASSINGLIGPLPGINTQTAGYTLALADRDGIVEMNVAGANTLTVPLNATVAFYIGTKIKIVQTGAGATTIAGAVGVTVHNAGAVGGQWKEAVLYKRGTDEWTQTT